MSKPTLNQSIFRLVVGLVVLTAIAIFANVWVATDEQTRERLNRDLVVAENVLRRVLQGRDDLLYNSAYVLTADFGFKQAVASKDQSTISSALSNHGQRIEADLMALVSLEGNTITSVPAALEVGQAFPYPQAMQSILQNGGYSSLMLLNQQLYQVIMLTVDAPTPIAIALVGFKLGNPTLEQLKEITQLETTLQVYHDQQALFTISTLPKEQVNQALNNVTSLPSWLSITVTKDIPFVSQQFVLSDSLDHQTIITLSENAELLFADFTSLQFNIVAIGVIVIILATFLAALFSGKISRPLGKLAYITERIAVGNYSKEMSVPTNTKEVSVLFEAFDTMQNNIQAREAEIIYQARHDILTSLFNRQHVKSILEKKIANQESFLAIGINIFGFRGINDIFGYHNGDLCLQELSKRLTKFEGIAARLTGGELLWIPLAPPSEESIKIIKSALETPIDTGNVSINLKVAFGLIRCPEDAQNAEELFKRLNIVLDEAQITRQFILPYSSELEARYSKRLAIITELKNTLSNASHELSLNYQPKLDLQKGQVTHVEALIRWTNAKLGFVSPEDFIAIAEQAGFIEKITHWVVNQAINDAAKFKAAGIEVNIAINLSAKDIMNPSLLPLILGLQTKQGLATNSLSFEITEGDLVRDHNKAITHLQAYQDAGFEIAIDDFGTGYSSMAYLQNLPINTLKVDKSFVLKLNEQQGDQKIVKTVIHLAHSFAMNVVAEGVENRESLQLLADWGCELAQGYYICKPAPADTLIEWFKDSQTTSWL
ncbi:EAL domain-containing protein [Paraglaciecola aestuariivivens]